MKSRLPRVYDSSQSLPVDYDAQTPVLAARPVSWSLEFRCFCLDRRVRTLSPYLRGGQFAKLSDYFATSAEVDSAKSFAEQVLNDDRVAIPRAIVLDVGWAVVEANAAWGSGIYGCDPDEVLNVIRHAVTNSHE